MQKESFFRGVMCIGIILALSGCGESVEHVDLPSGRPDEQLVEYTAKGDLKAVKFLIVKQKANPLYTDKDQNSALHWAAAKGYDDIVLYLLQKKVPVDIGNREGCTPLHLAAKNKQLNTVKLLLEHGANGFVPVGTGNANAITLALESGAVEIAELLLARPDCQLNGAELIYAILTGQSEFALKLINRGSPLTLGVDNQNALELAAAHKQIPVVSALLKKGMTSSQLAKWAAQCHSDQEFTRFATLIGCMKIAGKLEEEQLGKLLQIALVNNQGRIAECLLNQYKDPQAQVSIQNIVEAAIGGKSALLALKKCGVNLNLTDAAGNTAAHLMAKNTKISYVAIVFWKAVGGNLNQVNLKGETPLMILCGTNRSDLGSAINTLINEGADPKISMPDGTNALTRFSRFINGDKGSYELGTKLLNKGAVPRKITSKQLELWLAHATGMKQAEGSNPQFAKEAKQDRQEHMRNSYSLPLRYSEGDAYATDFVLALLKSLPPEEAGILNEKSTDGTPLISKAVSSELLIAMIAAGADASELDPKMVFFSALYAGNSKIVKTMLEKGADANWLDKGDSSTVAIALASFRDIDSPGIGASLGALSVVELLLNGDNYEINRTNAYGHTVAYTLLEKVKHWESLFSTSGARKKLYADTEKVLAAFSRCKYQANKKDIDLISNLNLSPELRKPVCLYLWKDTPLTFLLRELTWTKEREMRGEEFDWENELEQVIQYLDDKSIDVNAVNAQQESAADLFCVMTTQSDKFTPNRSAYLPSRNRQQLKWIGEKLAARGARPSASFQNMENEFTAPLFRSVTKLISKLQRLTSSRSGSFPNLHEELAPLTQELRQLPTQELSFPNGTTIRGELLCQAVRQININHNDASNILNEFIELDKSVRERGLSLTDGDLKKLVSFLAGIKPQTDEIISGCYQPLLYALKDYKPGKNAIDQKGLTIWTPVFLQLHNRLNHYPKNRVLMLSKEIGQALSLCVQKPSDADIQVIALPKYDKELQAAMGIPIKEK